MIRVVVFNATFHNIPIISWWSVLTLSHNVVTDPSTPRLTGIRTHKISGDRH
jgi:hypothetical protein